MVLRLLVGSARAVAGSRLAAASGHRCLPQARYYALTTRAPSGVLRAPTLSLGCSVRHFSHVVKTPGFGAESITEGTVQEWKVQVGDAVTKGDIIAMIETDKVTVEVAADAD